MANNRSSIKILVGAIIACFMISNIYLWRQKKNLEARLFKKYGMNSEALAASGTFDLSSSSLDIEQVQAMRMEMEKKLQEQEEKLKALEEKHIACVEKLKVLAPWSEDILPAPQFAPEIPAVLKTNYMGEIKVSWIPVKGVKRTQIVVTDLQGKVVKTHYSPHSTLYLKNLPLPDKKTKAVYFVSLSSVNGNDEAGPESEKREVHVYPYSRIMAPGIEKISIED